MMGIDFIIYMYKLLLIKIYMYRESVFKQREYNQRHDKKNDRIEESIGIGCKERIKGGKGSEKILND